MLGMLAAMLMQGAAPTANVITRPDWVTLPSASEFAAYYPADAFQKKLEGRAVIRCRVDSKGLLTECVILSEEPTGGGFGPAALQISTLFQMRGRSKDGVRTEGGQITIPIRFRLPEIPPPGTVTLSSLSWAKKPGGNDVARVYPQRAVQHLLSGQTVMKCLVAPDGRLTDCRVVEENPVGEGFGEATLKLAPYFTMQPLQDGRPVGGGTINIPINFSILEGARLKDIVVVRPDIEDGSATLDCRSINEGVDNCMVVRTEPSTDAAVGLAMALAAKMKSNRMGMARFRVKFIFKKGDLPLKP